MQALRPITLTSLLVLSMCLGSGCVVGRHFDGRRIPAESVPQIVIGKTTKQDILDVFGPPRVFSRVELSDLAERLVSRVGGGSDQISIELDPTLFDEAYLYEFRQENETFLTVFFLYTYFMRDRKSDQLLVIFDPNDRVSHVAFVEGTKELENL